MQCISDKLKQLCHGDEDYASVSDHIVECCVEDTDEDTPTKDDIQNMIDMLYEYFEEVISADDATTVICEAANAVWGDEITHITAAFMKKIPAKEEYIESGEECIDDGECNLCEREIKLTRHHLIPKTTWPRMKKRLRNAKSTIESLHSLSSRIKETSGDTKKQKKLVEEQFELQLKLESILGDGVDLDSLPSTITHETIRDYLSRVCLLCRQCHSTVHRLYPEMELAENLNTLERLLQCSDIMKFAKWASKQGGRKKK